MTNEHRDWQRQTALAKVERLRSEARKSGAPMSDERMARAAAGYVGVCAEQVLRWMRGEA